jgi:hypothetical protein
MGQSLLIRDRELVFRDISMGRVVVFSCRLEVEKCLLRMGLEVDLFYVVTVLVFHWCSAYIRVIVL